MRSVPRSQSTSAGVYQMKKEAVVRLNHSLEEPHHLRHVSKANSLNRVSDILLQAQSH